MKKIYILTAVFALLTLSLNAQDVAQSKAKTLLTAQSNKHTDKYDKALSMNQLEADIKGMSSVLQPTISPNGSRANGTSRAPLKLNAGEELVGPFTTYDTSISGYNSVGYPTAYGDNYQQILITTDLDPSEFNDHIGDEIVGFRFALAGNTSQTAVLYDFIAWPYAGNSFDQNHQYTWSIPEVAGSSPEIGDITITVGSGDVNLRDITVYGDNNAVLTTWNSLTGATTTVNLNGTNYASYNMPTGWSTTGYILRWQSSTDGYLGYMSGSPTITLSSSLFEGQSSVRVVINASTDDTSYGIYVNNEGKALTSSLADYTWNLTASVPGYIELQAGQWYEYYLDEPVTFDIGNDITGMRMGYFYFQYPSTETSELLNPIAVNPQSIGHSHASYMYKPNGTTYTYDDIEITLPSQYTNIRSITISSGGTTITSWNYTDNQGTFPTGWGIGGTLSLRYEYDNTNVSLYSSNGTGYLVFSGDMLEGYSNVTVAIYFSTSSRNSTATVGVNGTNKTTTSRTGSTQNWTINGTQAPNYQSGWWTESLNGDLAVQLIFKSKKLTPEAPTVTNVVGDENVTITITPDPNTDGNLVYYVDDNGNHVQDLTFPRGETDYTVTVHAYTTETDDWNESPEAVVPIVIPHLQTATPVITTTTNADGTVTVTATGAGLVSLSIDGGTPVTDNGSVSVTLPAAGISSYTVTATATAKEDGKAVSETATLPVTVTPTGGEWLPMSGTYNNANDVLSLKTTEIDEDGKYIDIMLIDQFLAPTLDNSHSDHYTYILKETVAGVEYTSNPVNIPVYKTNSAIQGMYTKDQVDNDINMTLKPNVINSKIEYHVHPDRNVLYYSLYRGETNETYPVIDAPHRVSQLQKYEEMVDGTVQYFLHENHTADVTPRYDRVSSEFIERLDTNYVQVTPGSADELKYVPVIWTFGLYTARGDGLNNSYGSDIKREKLGNATVKIIGQMSGKNNEENTGNGWEGLFKVGEDLYCIYTPEITINGIVPAEKVQNDDDVCSYVPYMYRAWCMYPGARNFTRVNGILTDAGELEIPYLLGTEVIDSEIGRIGSAWENGGSERLQWAFGVPRDEDPENVTIAVRFYYKKNVAEVGQNGLRTANRDGEEDTNDEYYIVQVEGTAKELVTAINEFYGGKTITSVTYVNAQGMTSEKPFSGLNIVVTRYSDGTTSTTKVMR